MLLLLKVLLLALTNAHKLLLMVLLLLRLINLPSLMKKKLNVKLLLIKNARLLGLLNAHKKLKITPLNLPLALAAALKNLPKTLLSLLLMMKFLQVL